MKKKSMEAMSKRSKIFSWALVFAMVIQSFGAVPPIYSEGGAEGDEEVAKVANISEMLFATRDDLMNSEYFNLDESNDKVGRINFGTRPVDVSYYYADDEQMANAGPITWLIAGKDGDNGLVLYSEEPIIGSDALSNEEGKSLFDTSTAIRTYYPPEDSGYGDTGDIQVVPNHWGASSIRDNLNKLVSDESIRDYYFKSSERDLMATSKISTRDSYNIVTYSTEDVLYAPRLNAEEFADGVNYKITVGEGDNLTIDGVNWGGLHWLRSPYPYEADKALYVLPGQYVHYGNIDDTTPSVSAAFKLDISSVLFASAASLSSMGQFEKLKPYDPMTLRLDGTSEGKALSGVTLNVEGTNLNFTGVPSGTRLQVIASTSDGTTYNYSCDVAGSGEVDLRSIVDLDDGVSLTAKAWLEIDLEEGSTLTYATNPTDDINFTIDKTAPTLSGGTANRESETNATITFTSDEAGEYYYSVVDSGASEPTIDTTGTGEVCSAGENTIAVSDLTAGKKDIYVVVKDAAGNVSEKLKIEIPVSSLTKPENLTWDSTVPGKAKWNAVSNASGYSVQLYEGDDPVAEAVIVTEAEYTFNITEEGSYTFKVKATNGSGNYADSAEAVSNKLFTVSFDTGSTDKIDMRLVEDGEKLTKPDLRQKMV